MTGRMLLSIAALFTICAPLRAQDVQAREAAVLRDALTLVVDTLQHVIELQFEYARATQIVLDPARIRALRVDATAEVPRYLLPPNAARWTGPDSAGLLVGWLACFSRRRGPNASCPEERSALLSLGSVRKASSTRIELSAALWLPAPADVLEGRKPAPDPVDEGSPWSNVFARLEQSGASWRIVSLMIFR